MNTTISRKIVRFVAAPVAAAGIIGGALLGVSGVADASTSDTTPAGCNFNGGATQCQTPGNVQINTQTGSAALNAAEQQYPFGYGYGGGLLFHHRGRH